MTKDEYINDVKEMIIWGMGDYVKTDVDDEADELLEETDDYDQYYKKRSAGNIIRIDHVFMVWLNGIIYAWNAIHKDKDELKQDDIIPNWDKVVDDSRCIGSKDGAVFYSEYCRL